MSCRACTLACDAPPQGLQGLQLEKKGQRTSRGRLVRRPAYMLLWTRWRLGCRPAGSQVAWKVRRCPAQHRGQPQHGLLQACQPPKQ